ncbi:MAG TPA: hypothetical protein VEB68_08380 [Croceibacterium sp.]|nr:hypothetical protein [Croceibacterium sp.]
MRLPERLPELEGPWLAGYKLLWWAMLAVSVAAVTAGQWFLLERGNRTDLQYFSAGLRASDESALVVSPLSPAAREAGVPAVGELLAIDGQPLGSAASYEQVSEALAGPDGRPVTLRLKPPGGDPVEVTVVRGPEHLAAADAESPATHRQRYLIYGVTATAGSLIVLVGAILLFRRRPSDPVAALLSLGLLSVPANDISALFGDHALRRMLDNGFDVIPMACNLLAFTTFPAGRFTPRWTLLILPAIVAWGTLMLTGGNETPLWLQFSIAIPALLLALASLGWRFVRMEPGPPRQQLKWVMLGLAGFLATGLIQFALFTIDSAQSDNATHFVIFLANAFVSTLGSFCVVGGILIALLRYRLYDADAAISRSALYALLTLSLIAVFAASETLIQSIGMQWFGAYAGTAGGAFAAAMAALLLVPLHQRLSKWAEKRFQRDLARLNAELPVLLAEVRNSSDPREFADNALQLVMRGVHASHGAILLADGDRLALAHAQGIPADGLADRLAAELPAHPERGARRADDPLLPLRLPLVTAGGTTTGWIVLGPHPDGSHYGKDDREALEDLAPPLARAIELAIERARREAAHEVERRTLTERLAQLEQQLAQVVNLTPPPQQGIA